jgi:EmrB/QacA subfamily drug resistance transporter
MKSLNKFFTVQGTTLIVVAVSTFMLPLDFTVVSVALHDIQIEFDASFTDMQWIVNGYTLMFAALLMAGGTLADSYGRKKIFALGIAIFMLSSLTCGLALSPLMLNFSRGFQGMGAALMFSAGIPLLVQEFTGAARAKAFGIFGLVVGTGAALGPLLGGLIIKTMGWRWAFLINVPVGAILIALIIWKVRETKNTTVHPFDVYGFITFTVAILTFIYAVIMGNGLGWANFTILSAFGVSLLLFISFIVIEKRSAYPMFDLSLFKKAAYVGISLTPMILSVSFWGMFLYTPMYFQSVMGYSPLEAGAAVLPFAIPLFIMGPVGAKATQYLNSRTQMALGILLVGIGALLLLLIPQGAGWLCFVPGALVAGTGTGFINGEIINIAMALVPAERSGMASGITGTMRQLGVALGFAGLGAFFSTVTLASYTSLASGSTHVLLNNTSLALKVAKGDLLGVAGSLPEPLREPFTAIANTAFYTGFHSILWCAALVSIMGAILVYALIPSDVHSNTSSKK